MEPTYQQWPLERYGFTPEGHMTLLYFMLFAFAVNIVVTRLSSITMRPPPEPRAKKTPARLLVVLGSGGHTSEMLNMLHQISDLQTDYYRTYVVSSGDGFSAGAAGAFEEEVGGHDKFDIVNVHRARKVHQSLITAPFSTLRCLWDCIAILYRAPPDIILTNGPGTGVCVVLASIFLRFFFYRSSTMRTIFVESWARVKTLSLSGKILKFFVDRFVVQWPRLVQEYSSDSVEYVGPLVR
jgi:beta-1,4-N-acetylglucosaminyltransferase